MFRQKPKQILKRKIQLQEERSTVNIEKLEELDESK